MNAARFLLVVLLLMWAVLAVAAVTQDSQSHLPTPHPVHGVPAEGSNVVAMEVGGEPFSGPWAWIFGCLIILVLAGCMWLATEQAIAAGPLRLAIACGTVLFLAAFTLMCQSDRQYVGKTAPMWGPFPEPTTRMMIGIWFPPMIFMLIYVLGFRRWFAPDGLATELTSELPSDVDEC